MNTIRIEILKPGLLTTIQDEGRPGMALFAIPASGVADIQSFHLANSLLGNAINNPVLECTQMGVSLKFHDSCFFAICGSDFGWSLNGHPIDTNKVLHAEEGFILDYANKRTMARAYIAFKGRILTTKTLDSYASYTAYQWGGNEGKVLQKGDILKLKPSNSSHMTSFPSLDFTLKPSETIQFNPGPEWNMLNKKQKETLFTNDFYIRPESNRMGARLHGPELKTGAHIQYSVPILPGFIQLLPDGQLIVVLQDGQTTGGYPRVGFIKRQNLNAFNQLLPMKAFRFVNKQYLQT